MITVATTIDDKPVSTTKWTDADFEQSAAYVPEIKKVVRLPAFVSLELNIGSLTYSFKRSIEQ
jgi:hypothetical protein